MATLLTSQADSKARNAVAEVIWRMALATHPPVTEGAATTYLSAMTRWETQYGQMTCLILRV